MRLACDTFWLTKPRPSAGSHLYFSDINEERFPEAPTPGKAPIQPKEHFPSEVPGIIANTPESND